MKVHVPAISLQIYFFYYYLPIYYLYILLLLFLYTSVIKVNLKIVLLFGMVVITKL